MSNVKAHAELDIGVALPSKFIHLLYVPTIYCNLGCQYCYLGKQTDTKSLKEDAERAVETLEYALKYFADDNILPFNLSLHGGEVTAIPGQTMSALFDIISNHYLSNYDQLMANGFRKQTPHIKTNLYNFDKYEEMFRAHHVSISGSVDLPLFLHEKYRTTKTNKSTLSKIKKNIALLAEYPHSKKLSATLFNEHFNHTDRLIEDIWTIHNELHFDMNNFNFMFGFESTLNDIKFKDTQGMDTESVEDTLQVDFYRTMKKAFVGTELEWGFKRNWFDEFTPSYCTSAVNCGDRFFLLQSNGDVYSCVRGQGAKRFYYGNIFNVPAQEILQNGKHNIRSVHQKNELHTDCLNCDYLKICNTGCAYVKEEQGAKKSYTCSLQKEIYKEYPQQYKPASEGEKTLNLNNYLAEIHPSSIERVKPANSLPKDAMNLSSDFYDETNALGRLIDNDEILKDLYSARNFVIEINDDCEFLSSQILKVNRSQHFIDKDDSISLHIRKSIFKANCIDITTNALYIQLLRDTKVVYGDEQREKQEHLLNQQVYYNQLESSDKGDQWLKMDLMPFLALIESQFLNDVANNLFVTTNSLRDYHYKKQQKNAFYHIQAINLPFQNIEFFWCK